MALGLSKAKRRLVILYLYADFKGDDFVFRSCGGDGSTLTNRNFFCSGALTKRKGLEGEPSKPFAFSINKKNKKNFNLQSAGR